MGYKAPHLILTGWIFMNEDQNQTLKESFRGSPHVAPLDLEPRTDFSVVVKELYECTGG